jgi:hypothetical protein
VEEKTLCYSEFIGGCILKFVYTLVCRHIENVSLNWLLRAVWNQSRSFSNLLLPSTYYCQACSDFIVIFWRIFTFFLYPCCLYRWESCRTFIVVQFLKVNYLVLYAVASCVSLAQRISSSVYIQFQFCLIWPIIWHFINSAVLLLRI